MLKLGLVGCGCVGKYICENLNKINSDYILHIYDRNPDKMDDVSQLSDKIYQCNSLEELKSLPLEYLIESASRDFVKDVAPAFLKKGINIIILSNGLLAFHDIKQELLVSAMKGDSKIYLPGGPPGIDTVLALQVYGINKSKYTSSRNLKHPLAAKVGPGKYFSGSVKEAMNVFNKTLNTSSVLAEASNGYDATEAEVSFSDEIEGYILNVNVDTEIGNLEVTLKGELDPDSGKFHYLAALSVIALLKKLTSRLIIGI